MLKACLPLLRRLRQNGKKSSRRVQCGARPTTTVKDHWTWPKGNKFLFPAPTKLGRKTKDIVCHVLTKARATFVPPKNTSLVLDVKTIRSHSGRHRAINDLKRSCVDPESAMVYARTAHRRTYDAYGRMNQEQAAAALNGSKRLQSAFRGTYK